MKYIVDFDRTLLDTGRFVAQVIADNKEDVLVTPSIWQFYNVRDYLYEDALGWLRSKAKEDLHILTAMTPSLGPESCDFQREKLHSGNFTEFVGNITFMVGEKGESAAKILFEFFRPTNLSYSSTTASTSACRLNQRYLTRFAL